VHPVDSYILRGKSAHLTCEVRSADKAYFVCNGEAMSESGDGLHREEARVDTETGREVRALSLEVTRNQQGRNLSNITKKILPKSCEIITLLPCFVSKISTMCILPSALWCEGLEKPFVHIG
jgi:hypothetical protein